MKNNITETYTQRHASFVTEHEQLIKKNRMISFLRLILFLMTIALMIIFWSSGIYLILSICGFTIVPFLILIKLNVNFSSKIKHLKELISINHNELEALKGNFSVFPAGDEFVNASHPYSYDLDIFGQESIYQSINRTNTAGGAQLLANSLQEPVIVKEEILEKQDAIKELAALLVWRQNFHATGNVVLENETDNSNNSGWFMRAKQNYSNDSGFKFEILSWLTEAYDFINKNMLKYLLFISPIVSGMLFILLILGILPFMGFVLFGLVQLFISGIFIKKVNKMHSQIGRKVEILNKYECLFILIENQEFNSVFLKSQKSALSSDKLRASKELNRLKKLVRYLDNRMNILFAFIANAYFLWDLQIVYRLEKWRNKNNQNLPQWLEVIYQFDFLSSFGSFAYNNPGYCVPEIKNGDFYLEMEQAGHPLIKDEVRIDNDLIINGYSQLLVITGANMAGKSTFLRTVGVNMILALAGSVVCAKKFVISPIHLHTSVRTSDSVQKNESYFFAELKRLKSIIDRMQAEEKLFVIIDEMLRGTNSKDKHHGSEALIEQLIRLKGSGLIATHDIGLGSLTEKYPDHVKNYRFEVEIKSNELEFDYKLKTGISQNLNATFLMKKMGITV